MRVVNHARWDVAKRFLNHTESFLARQGGLTEELVLSFLKAVREVLPLKHFVYSTESHLYRLQKGNQLEVQPLSHPANLPKKIPFLLFSFQGLSESIDHRLWITGGKLSGNKKRFFDLIVKQYCSVLADHFEQSDLVQETKQENQDKRPPLRSKYRKYKEVILSIEAYARKKNLSPELVESLDQVPDLKEQILDFQTQLIKDLEGAKKRQMEQKELALTLQIFFQRQMEELANRLALGLGLMDLFSSQGQDSPQAQPNKHVESLLRRTKNHLDILVAALEGDKNGNPLAWEKMKAEKLMHQAMALFAKSNQSRNVEFKLAPQFAQVRLMGNLNLLIKAVLAQFDFCAHLARLWGETEVTRIECNLAQRPKEVEIQVKALDVTPTLRQLERLHIPQSLVEALRAEQSGFEVIHYFLAQTAKRHEGSFSFEKDRDNHLLCRLILGKQSP